jgi:hypothetical protein
MELFMNFSLFTSLVCCKADVWSWYYHIFCNCSWQGFIPPAFIILLAILILVLWLKGQFVIHSKRFLLTFLIVLLLGWLVYAYPAIVENGGNNEVSLLALMYEPLVSSFKMFIFETNLDYLSAHHCEDEKYMFVLSIVQIAAGTLSILFIISYVGYRIVSKLTGLLYWIRRCVNRRDNLYVFYGINEHSLLLANDIHRGEDRNWASIFIDVSEDDLEEQHGIFSSILGSINGRHELIMQMTKMGALMVRQHHRVDNNEDILTGLGLQKHFKSSKHVHILLLDDDETKNLNRALTISHSRLMMVQTQVTIYCHASRCQANLELETMKGNWELRIVDSAYLAVMQLKSTTAVVGYNKKLCDYYPYHPINFIDEKNIDTERALVNENFNAIIIGFGQTGRDALNFIYEFAQFPYADDDECHFFAHVYDKDMDNILGQFFGEEPAFRELHIAAEHSKGLLPSENSSLVYPIIPKADIIYHNMNVNSVEFRKHIAHQLEKANYIVISLDDDDIDINLATELYKYYLRNNIRMRGKIFVRAFKPDNKFKMEAIAQRCGGAIVLFGCYSDIFTKKYITEDDIMIQAYEFGKCYGSITGGSSLVFPDRRSFSYRCKREEDKRELEKRTKQQMQILLQTKNVNSLTDEEITRLGAVQVLRGEYQNKQNAYHIYTKLKLMGLMDVKSKRFDEIVNAFEAKKDGEKDSEQESPSKKLYGFWKDGEKDEYIENVSRCEHYRWNASHCALGYLPWEMDTTHKAPQKPVYKMRFANTSSSLLMRHACLISWNGLTTISKDDSLKHHDESQEDSVKENDYQKFDAGVVVTSLYYAYLRYKGKGMRRNELRKANEKPAVISKELLEKLAECVHQMWMERRGREGWTLGGKIDSDVKTTPLLVPYSELSEIEKNYDRRTAKVAITAIKNYEEGKKKKKNEDEKTGEEKIKEEKAKEEKDVIDGIGEAIHIAWAEGRLREGWVYGQKKDSVAKTTPCLVSFNELPEEEKEYDLLIARHVWEIFKEENNKQKPVDNDNRK